MNTEDYYYMTRAEMKAVAKDRLRQPGVWLKFALVALVPLAILMITVYPIVFGGGDTTDIAAMSAAQYAEYTRAQLSQSVQQSLLTNLIQLFFVTAMSFTALDLMRNRDQKISLSHLLFRCFNSKYFWMVLGVDVLTYLAVTIGTMLLIIPGILLSYGLTQAYLVLYDARERGVRVDLFNVLAESYRMMRGYKFDYFVLQLSFIGWYLLVVITGGLAYFWVGPYMTFTNATFYEHVRTRYERDFKQSFDDGAL